MNVFHEILFTINKKNTPVLTIETSNYANYLYLIINIICM